MYALWIALALIVNLVVHEAAHAVAMRHRGIRVVEAGFGFGPTLATWTPRRLGYPLKFKLLPLGAYVMPAGGEDKRIEALSYRDQTTCYGAGVIANLILAFLGYATLMVRRLIVDAPDTSYTVWSLAICLALAAIFWYGRRWVGAYLLPLLGLGVTWLFVSAIIASPTTAIGGPISLFSAPQGMAVGPVTALQSALVALIIVSVSLGMLNALPISVLDGGRIAATILRRVIGPRASNLWQVASSFLLIGLISLALATDTMKLFA
jgi:membrane-associated protease RseP (regulator of RpoE activity)